MAQININGMKFYAYHGCFDEEKIVGTHFVVNCSLDVDCKQAALTDDLSRTVNYQEVYSVIAEQMKQSSDLLEHIAYRIIKAIMNTFAEVKHVAVEICKLNPPLGGQMDSVSVKMTNADVEIGR
ncbi:MAG: dihydroneopterin aldolase [Bacteroidales bacterium]|nr:dihydroneopterin aldolase [Bacteroidales bacterium]